MNQFQAVILAAGKSSRFRSEKNKLLTTMCGQELILYPITALIACTIPMVCVVGHKKEELRETINKHYSSIKYIEQLEQKGTGHAVACALPLLTSEHILIINGDMPLITQELIRTLCDMHITRNATLSFVVSHVPSTTQHAYGRVIRDNASIKIIEARDFTGTHNYPINAGIYCIKRSFLEKTLTLLTPNNSAGELYITDLIHEANMRREIIETVEAPFEIIQGVNTLEELSHATRVQQLALCKFWLHNGVYIENPDTTYLDVTISLGEGTSLAPGVSIKGNTVIGKNCSIGAYSLLHNAHLDNNIIVHPHTVIYDSHLQQETVVGPFAHIRGHSTLAKKAIIGNFVEVNKTTLGIGSKAKHLSYLGNATIGSSVNIGAGTITCNYDGHAKHQTIIEDNAFIGSNSSLVAPVTIGAHAMIGAGSVITENVPAYALALARSRQVNKEEYMMTAKKTFTAAQPTDEPLSE